MKEGAELEGKGLREIDGIGWPRNGMRVMTAGALGEENSGGVRENTDGSKKNNFRDCVRA